MAPSAAILPNMGGLDLTPLVVLIGVYALRIILINNAGLFRLRLLFTES